MKRAAILLGAIALGTGACSDSPSSPSSTGSRFVLRLSASQFAAGQALLVTVSRVRVFRSDRDFIDVPLTNGAPQITCDLKKLQSVDGELAAGGLTPAQYTDVRVQIQSMTLYLDNPSPDICTASVRIPSGRSTPIALPSNEIQIGGGFTIESGADTVMRIGLNSEQSIRAGSGGSYTFTPVISVLGAG